MTVEKELGTGAAKVSSSAVNTGFKIRRRVLKIVKRAPSAISFPYRDLESGISVAQAIFAAGGVPLTNEQLAGVMGLQAGSGNYVLKVATARIFGLVVNANGKYSLTDNGFAIVDKDETRRKAAKAEAFLTVPLYRRVYDDFKGKQLPPRPLGLEQTFVRFGVSEKQKTAARQIFDKSAAQAGFFPNGPDRLIEPIIGASPLMAKPMSFYGGGEATAIDSQAPAQPANAPLVESVKPLPDLHPFIQGLLDTLPEPNTNWTIEGRAKWLQAAANIFDLMYKGTGEISIAAKNTPPAGG